MKESRRILLLVTQADWGGVQSFLIRFAAQLQKDGRDVLLAAGGDGELWHEAERAGIPTRRLKHVVREISPAHDVRAISEIKRLIDEFKPDAIHLNSTKMGVVGSIASALSRTNPWTVYRIGGWVFLEPMSEIKRWVYRTAEQTTSRLKDVIITVHPGDRELAMRLNIRPRHLLTTVANGLDVASFVASLKTRGDARQKLGIPEHAFVFGTIANAYATKGLLPYLDVLAKALREDRNAFGVIIGDGPELEQLIAHRSSLSDVADRILLPGHVDQAPTYLSAFDVFVLPSRKEGMPWTVLEAMAAGLPVITTDVGACKWMLTDKHGDAGIVVPKEDPMALGDALHRLRTHTDEREALARAGRRSVNERFSWNATYTGNRDALDRR